MIPHRLRGLVNLHMILATVVTVLLLLAYAGIYNYLPFVEHLSGGVSLTGYALCVVAGLVAGSRHLRRMAGRFHQLNWIDAVRLATRQVVFMALVIFAFMFAFKDRAMSRLFMGTYLCLGWFLLVLVNAGLPRLLARFFFERTHKIPTLFVGSPQSLAQLRQWLDSKQVLGLQPVGFLTKDGQPAGGTEPPFLGDITVLPNLIPERRVAQVILLEIPRSKEEGRFIIETCQRHGCRLLIYSNLADLLGYPLVTVNEEGHQFYTLQEEPLEDPINRVVKRLFDVALALPVVVFVLPPLNMVVWIIQRFQASGPLMFAQPRTGLAQQPFRLLKYRSMYADRGRDEGSEAEQARRGDTRIYPFGRFLRRTSLDEFPQFWNVLNGEMSIVGPRPHMLAHDAQFADQMMVYRTRFFVKPGITGLAQCRGYRGEITDRALLEKRIKFDIIYVTQWSIWLDLQITIETAWQVVFPPRTAY